MERALTFGGLFVAALIGCVTTVATLKSGTEIVSALNHGAGLAGWAQFAGGLLIGGATLYIAHSATEETEALRWHQEAMLISKCRSVLIQISIFLRGAEERLRQDQQGCPTVGRKAEIITRLGTELWQSSAQFGPARRDSAALLAQALGRMATVTADAVMDSHLRPVDPAAARNALNQSANLLKHIGDLEPELLKMQQQPRTAAERSQRRLIQRKLLAAEQVEARTTAVD